MTQQPIHHNKRGKSMPWTFDLHYGIILIMSCVLYVHKERKTEEHCERNRSEIYVRAITSEASLSEGTLFINRCIAIYKKATLYIWIYNNLITVRFSRPMRCCYVVETVKHESTNQHPTNSFTPYISNSMLPPSAYS